MFISTSDWRGSTRCRGRAALQPRPSLAAVGLDHGGPRLAGRCELGAARLARRPGDSGPCRGYSWLAEAARQFLAVPLVHVTVAPTATFGLLILQAPRHVALQRSITTFGNEFCFRHRAQIAFGMRR